MTSAITDRTPLALQWRRRPNAATAAFVVALAGALLIGLLQGVRPFYADSGGYWSLGESFTVNGHFSLLNFESEVRGYVLPLIAYALRSFAGGSPDSQSTAVTLFNVLVFASIGTILGPRLAEVTWPQRHWGLIPRVAFMAALLVFWGGDLNYPLTDFPGLAMAMLALVAVAQSEKPGHMLVAGLAAGAAVNLRPAYLPFVLVLIPLVGWSWLERRSTPHASVARRTLCACLLVAGFFVVSLPQALSNERHYGTLSFIPGADTSLSGEILTKGMYAQRWDSYERPIGTPNAIGYADRDGKHLLEQQPGDEIKSSSQYVGLVISHPFVMIPMLVRRAINGMDVRYNTIYVENSDSGGRIWLRIAGFALVFLALARLLWAKARRSLGAARWRYPLALSVCCVTVLPSAVETRYMLPIYVIVYMLALAPGWPTPIDSADSGWRRLRTAEGLTVGAVVFALFIWHVLSNVHTYIVHPF